MAEFSGYRFLASYTLLHLTGFFFAIISGMILIFIEYLRILMHRTLFTAVLSLPDLPKKSIFPFHLTKRVMNSAEFGLTGFTVPNRSPVVVPAAYIVLFESNVTPYPCVTVPAAPISLVQILFPL